MGSRSRPLWWRRGSTSRRRPFEPDDARGALAQTLMGRPARKFVRAVERVRPAQLQNQRSDGLRDLYSAIHIPLALDHRTNSRWRSLALISFSLAPHRSGARRGSPRSWGKSGVLGARRVKTPRMGGSHSHRWRSRRSGTPCSRRWWASGTTAYDTFTRTCRRRRGSSSAVPER